MCLAFFFFLIYFYFSSKDDFPHWLSAPAYGSAEAHPTTCLRPGKGTSEDLGLPSIYALCQQIFSFLITLSSHLCKICIKIKTHRVWVCRCRLSKHRFNSLLVLWRTLRFFTLFSQTIFIKKKKKKNLQQNNKIHAQNMQLGFKAQRGGLVLDICCLIVKSWK